MSKPIYADYVNHMLRYYCRNRTDTNGKKTTAFRTPRDRLNWKVCDAVITRLPQDEQDVVESVYRQDTRDLRDAIRIYCKTTGYDVNRTTRIVQAAAYQVAQERGL